MSYENSLLSVSADTATSAKFSPDGFIEVDAVDSDFKMGMVYNDGYYTLPWYNVTVDGHHSNVASMTKTDDGIILYGDNLVNVTVSANNDDYSIGTNFSTTANSVLIYDIDDYTIGIAIDEDGDGTYETDTPIAQTEHNGDMNYDGTVNSLDLLLMKQSILGESKIMGDLNLDGTTNIIDLIILKQKLLEG
jgi:hypothetical protein